MSLRHMEDIIARLMHNVNGVKFDESLTGLIRNSMRSPNREPTGAANYFTVTEIVNPAQTFWARTHPEVKKPPKLRRKLARGKWLQNIASIWFMKMPDFLVEEGVLEGAFAGLKGVRGSIDYLIGDLESSSILELKTKSELPKSADEVIEKHPNDLEQLVFYSVLHPSLPKVNYLVFMKNSHPYALSVFKVTTKDPGTIKSIINKRITDLKKALETKDPTQLGACRYFKDGCHFESGTCQCDKLESINIDALKRSIDIAPDLDLKEKLETAKNSSDIKHYASVYEVIAPRKSYIRNIEGLEEDYDSSLKDDYFACLWASVKDVKEVKLSFADRQQISTSDIREPRLCIPYRWMKVQHSGKDEAELLPYMLKVSTSSSRNALKNPHQYYLAELAIICAALGKDKGLICVLYPNMNKAVAVFRVSFINLDTALAIIKDRIDGLEAAASKEDILLSPPCPEFMNGKGTCPMMQRCNADKEKGCSTKP